MKNVLIVLIFINKTRACLSDAIFLRSQPVHPEKCFLKICKYIKKDLRMNSQQRINKVTKNDLF